MTPYEKTTAKQMLMISTSTVMTAISSVRGVVLVECYTGYCILHTYRNYSLNSIHSR